MASKMSENPELVQAFKSYVDALGGENCTQWSRISAYLKEKFNYSVKSPSRLRHIYRILFLQDHELDSDSVALLMKTFIKNDLAWSTSLKEFNLIVQKNMQVQRKLVVLYCRKALQLIINLFSRKKNANIVKVRTNNLNFLTYKIMINLYKVQDQEPLLQEIKKYAIILRNLLLIFADNIQLVGESRAQLFEVLSKHCSRRKIENILFYLDYLHRLKQIYENNLDDMGVHPLLKKNIEDNKSLLIYQKYIQYRDYEKKFQLYNLSMDDMDVIDQQYMNNKIFLKSKSQFVTKQKVKPRFGIQKEVSFKDPHTVMFITEYEEYEKNQPLTRIKQKNQKLNELYLEAFEDEIQQNPD